MKTLLITALLIVCFSTIGSTQPQQKVWEYKFEFNINERKANQLGNQGWELVAIGAAGTGPTANVETYVFRRAR